jgi:hypothetical protein
MANEMPRAIRAKGRRATSFVAKQEFSQKLAAVAPWVCVALLCSALLNADASAQHGEPKIVVATTITVEPETQTPLPIQISPPGAVPNNSFLRLRGLPPTISLTAGYAIGPGSWAIPLYGLPTLKVNVPTNVSGRSELVISLVTVDGALVAEAKTMLVVGAAPVVAPAGRASPPQNTTGPVLPAAPIPAGSLQRNGPLAPRPPELSPELRAKAEKLVGLGDRYLEQGNIEIARQFFRRAAAAGLAEGAIGLAATYDPSELARLRVQGVVADRAEARKWYERARELGAPDAEERLAKLGAE